MERGTVVLAPNDSRRVAVYRGEGRPDGQAPVVCEAMWSDSRYARTFKLGDVSLQRPEGGYPQVVVREDGIEIEVVTSLPSREE